VAATSFWICSQRAACAGELALEQQTWPCLMHQSAHWNSLSSWPVIREVTSNKIRIHHQDLHTRLLYHSSATSFTGNLPKTSNLIIVFEYGEKRASFDKGIPTTQTQIGQKDKLTSLKHFFSQKKGIKGLFRNIPLHKTSLSCFVPYEDPNRVFCYSFL